MDDLLLSGTFDHTLDAKGRVTLPARYREHFLHGVVLVRFPEGERCISVYHPAEWAKFDTRYIEPLNVFESKTDAWRARAIYMNQDAVEPDGQGRVLLGPADQGSRPVGESHHHREPRSSGDMGPGYIREPATGNEPRCLARRLPS